MRGPGDRGGRTYICNKKPAGESRSGMETEAFEAKWYDRYDYGVDE